MPYSGLGMDQRLSRKALHIWRIINKANRLQRAGLSRQLLRQCMRVSSPLAVVASEGRLVDAMK